MLARPIVFTCCAFALSATVLRAGEAMLVNAGRTAYTIVLPEQPSPAESLAADEIAKYVKQISGADLPVRNGDAAPSAPRIVLRSTHDNKSPAFVRQDDDAYQIRVDKSGDIRIESAGDHGLLVGAFRLLEMLGCRFLAPQFEHYRGSAEFIPKSQTLKLTVGVTDSRPALLYRKLYVEEGRSHDETNLKQLVEWMPKAGYNVLVVPTNYQGRGRVKWDNWREALTPELQRRGIVIEVGGHGYQNFLSADMPDPDAPAKTLFDTHVDWFARGAQGNRHRETNWVFNTANADAVRFFVANILKYVQARPEIQIFDLWPPDGERWDESDEGKRQGMPTDRMVMLTNLVREQVAKVRPDLRIECIAYARYTEPPVSQKLNKDVLVDFCPIDQSFEAQIDDPNSQRNARYMRDLRGWSAAFPDGDISLYSYYRKYAWQSLPVVLPRYMQGDLRAYRAIGIRGVSTYSEPGDWFAYELNHYALARMAWDPDLDVDALIADFCAARYGSAADAARRVFDVLGEVVRTCGSIPFTSLKSPQQIDDARKRLDDAVAALKTKTTGLKDDDARRRNFDRLLVVCEHASRDLAIQLMRAQSKPEEQVRHAVLELHEFLAAHAGEGVSLERDDATSAGRLMRRYGLGAKRSAAAGAATTKADRR